MKNLLCFLKENRSATILMFALALSLVYVSNAFAPPDLCINVTKQCIDASASGEPIRFSGTVTNCGGLELFDVTVVDDHAGTVLGPLEGPLGPGQQVNYWGWYIPSESPSTNTVTATGVYNGDMVHQTAKATCEVGKGDEGCTPGYWKNHEEAWSATSYRPDDLFEDVFGVNLGPRIVFLSDAIRAGGGGWNKIARHATAALLSASHPGINYPIEVGEIALIVQRSDGDPEAVEILVKYNEMGCPL
jgi:hypothetical protein